MKAAAGGHNRTEARARSSGEIAGRAVERRERHCRKLVDDGLKIFKLTLMGVALARKNAGTLRIWQENE